MVPWDNKVDKDSGGATLQQGDTSRGDDGCVCVCLRRDEDLQSVGCQSGRRNG